jgi:hypothetical protein
LGHHRSANNNESRLAIWRHWARRAQLGDAEDRVDHLPLMLSIMTRSIDRSSAHRARHTIVPSTLLLTIRLAVFEFKVLGGEIVCVGNHLCINMNELPSIV